MSAEKDEDFSPSQSPAKEPWETPRVVESSIKDNTGYYTPSHDDNPRTS